ncbi:MAG: deoxynucleoside kinase [Candidatus Portnoybacteria bacterium]|nr:deoxynucleoside kinase [Candidatus Portnoybacteria bacterium]
MKKGKFIVVDGTDGSGKATQVKLLVSRLKGAGIRVKTIDFPRYYENLFGKMIGECLAGEHGDFRQFSPYVASALYAADRFESSTEIKKWLDEGCMVLADRYTSSNQMHQGGKIGDDKEREDFLSWLDRMEFGIFKIPRPSAILFLDVPTDFVLNLLKNKSAKKKKDYLKGRADAHESSADHLRAARESALKIIQKNNNWIRINCVQDDRLLSKREVNDLVWKELKKILK